MGQNSENEREFKAQSYFRLLKYARPYWFRLTVGIVAGFKAASGSTIGMPEASSSAT